MDPTELKKNFEEQIAKTETQILELEKNLEKAKEYKTKLVGGLETIGLLTDEQPPTEEAPGTPSSVEPTE
jgi:ferritin-like metal-binding protein YciE|tara:strand:- start:70 stop:279 length:210 start_codon:yes stop_codon:yes gene_type:complete